MSTDHHERLEVIASALERLAEDLDAIALDALTRAVAEGADRRPSSDRQLMQARRSIDKAARTLRVVIEPEGFDLDGP